MTPLVRAIVLIGMVLGCAACGPYKAGTQPSHVDVAELKSGRLSREKVVERLGKPRAVTRNPDGGTTERFEFYEGSDSTWKGARVVLHVVGDVVTLGAWEIVANPIEFFVRGGRLVGEAQFDSEGGLRSFIIVGRDVRPMEQGQREGKSPS
ncbi:MAG: hypothetical protein H8K06_07690 [Nitrospira sp.]|uniref:Lipoprotein n=1 Tax=Nitrospira defluvii TaxID=330214 RepID=A0ABM8RLJ4_9BACT|nr:hypothetical protein [Nitrospira defluvii]MCS6326951.1 hypothetical protein [Nitrospira sp.]CAE6759707.1 conserved exported hypothetical protein [Nitrospira defluvii]